MQNVSLANRHNQKESPDRKAEPIPNLLTDALAEEMNADFEIMRQNRERRLKEQPPTARAMAQFQQDFNSFINHRKRPFEPMIEREMKL